MIRVENRFSNAFYTIDIKNHQSRIPRIFRRETEKHSIY